MKKHLILLLVPLLTLASCENILQKDPLDFGTPDLYYNSPEKLEAALAGVYDVMGGTYLYGYTMPYRMGFECDEGFFARINPSTGPQVYNFQAGHVDVYNFWRDLYKGIDRANTLLKYLTNISSEDIDPETLNRVKGETLFLRAYYYFMLVQNFGGVPLILTPTTDPEAIDIPRASIKDVYERITKDMIEAESLVLDIRTLNFAGRISKSAVRGILARVYLHMAGEPLKDTSKYEDAKLWALKVIEDKKANHSLNPSYRQIFINYAQDKYDVSESIWEVEFRGNNTDAYYEGGVIGYVNGPFSLSNEAGRTFGGVRVTYKLFDSYKFGDVRRDWNISCYNIDAKGNSDWATGITPDIIYKRYAGKYRREYETLLPKAVSVTPQNFPLLRYSDVLLMFAEAENELNGPTQAAIDAVNQVRLRATSTGIKSINLTNGGSGYTSAPTVEFEGGPQENLGVKAIVGGGKVVRLIFENNRVFREARGEGFTTPPAVKFVSEEGSGATANVELFDKDEFKLTENETASQQDFRQAIQDERFKELCFEMLRKGDLIRWGNFVYEMNKVGAHVDRYAPDDGTKNMASGYKNVWEKYLLWPIPTKELTLNKALTQNPYW